MDSLKVLSNKCSAEPEKAAATAPLDLEQVRERLRDQKGPEFWRSLDELAETPDFQQLLHREFPRQASEWVDDAAGGVSRRNFLKLASASLAMAGMTACTRQPVEKIVPYVDQPEQVIPGKPLFFATTTTLGGYGLGILAESHEGRPTKVEGNPDHPASLGATDIFAQASVLTLYDPERSQRILKNGRIDKWSNFIAELGSRAKALEPLGGEGIRIVTGDVTSPTLTALLGTFLARFPKARWQRWEPAGDHHAAAASQAAFGALRATHLDVSKAKVLVAIESDFLASGPGAVRYARQFADGRRVRKGKTAMSRLYAVESTPTNTAILADHRLQIPAAQVEAFAAALAERLGVGGAALPSGLALDPRFGRWADEVAKDLKTAGAGQTLVVAGEGASPSAHVLVHAINGALGNVGQTVVYTEPIAAPEPGGQAAALANLVAEIEGGKVELLLLLGVNPAYSAPADVAFANAIRAERKKVPLIVHHGLFEDETSQHCHWHVPATHELESWGDARTFDGTVSLIQPLIEPLHEGAKTPLEILGVLLGKLDATPYDFVHDQWKGKLPGEYEAAFRKVLHDGVVPDSALPPVAVPAVAGGAIAAAVAEIAAAVTRDAAPGALTLLLRPDPTIYDGRFANHPWLQELPKPLTKITWDNALLLSPRTAGKLNLKTEDPVEVSCKDEATGVVRKLATAVWIQPGQADGTALLTLGYGRTRAGERGTGHGFDANRLRTAKNLWSIPGISIRALGGRYEFASTQNHHLLESQDDELRVAMDQAEKRELVRVGTLADYVKNPNFFNERAAKVEDLSFYPGEWDYSKGHSWGMAIDLSSCTGCSSCMVACQAENNIPTVGKEQVLRRRSMHWIRVDRYFQGDLDDPAIHTQPVPCMQCENAPCEVVCPVAATSHSDEGLNDMVYNRCVGTRYCSNNCPYKVRRFNFLRFSDKSNPLIALAQNPDVTVRMRGVMEKCTYCVQRIEEAKITSKVTGKPIAEPSLKTACQQACPTQAIVFGDLSQPDQEVTRQKAEPTNYTLLAEVNTRPRTTYLAKLRNANPALEPMEGERKENGHA